MRQLKKRFNIKLKNNTKKKKRKIKNRMFPILLSILVISVTTATTQAFFNSKVSFADIVGGDGEGKLDITNGNVKWEFGKEPISWYANGNSLPVIGGETYISNPNNNDVVTYGPVTLTSTSNLTTNVDLAVNFTLKKIGGVDESGDGGEGSSEITNSSKLVEPFEVIVGDIDNFGYTFYKNENVGRNAYADFSGATALSSNLYDIYNDYDTPFNRAFTGIKDPTSTLYSRQHNGMSVFPNNNYDATGTDRRMVNSGFYDWLNNNGFSSVLGKSDAYDTLKQQTNSDFGFNQNGTVVLNSVYYSNLANYYWAWFASNSTKIWYDGYTDRALKGIYGVWSSDKGSRANLPNDNWLGIQADKFATSFINGTGIEKNWAYLNKVEPLTFKYGKIPENGDIYSICIQIYVDDLQPKHENYSDKTSFSYVSQNQYKVSISSDGANWTEIPTWSTKINELSQSGPSGYMVTLNLDTQDENVMKIFKNASGLDGKGLKLKIDDETQVRKFNGNGENTVSGDSYAIDFAKMTVNGSIDATTNDKMSIEGQVIDNVSKKTLEGVTIITSNAASTETDTNGKYSLSPVNEDITIKFIKDGYKTVTKTISKGSNITLNVAMEPKTSTSAKNKIDIEVVIDELVGDNSSTSIDTSKVTRAKLERKDSNGKNLINFATIEEGEPEATIDGEGNNVIRTVTKYNNISSISTAIQQAQCSIGMKPGSVYKVYYKLILKDKDSIDAVSDEFSLEFTSSLTAKATQENNPGWNVEGSGEKYKASYLATGTVASTSTPSSSIEEGSTSGGETTSESTKEIDKILENDTPEIYFQNARGWGSPSITLNGKSINSTINVTEVPAWYKGILDDSNTLKNNSFINVKDNNNTNNSSGKLYYFNTKKVFICTE